MTRKKRMKGGGKSKCLLILPRDIFPIISGYSLKNEALIKALNNRYELVLVLISNKEVNKESIEFYQEHSADFHLFIFSKFHFLFNALVSVFSTKPIQVGYYSFRKVRDTIEECSIGCDFAIAALVRTILYLDNIPKDTVRVFDMVDSIGLNYQHSKKNVHSLFWKLLYWIETKRLLKFEEKYIKSSDVTFLFNQKEVDYWNYAGNVKWLPHGVRANLFNYKREAEQYKDYVAFIGKMDYRPNIDAVLWYIDNIHSKLSQRPPLLIVGAKPTKNIIETAAKYDDIKVTGYVEDPYDLLNSAKAVIAPMQTGGGIQNKVLEAMALGKVAIVSSLAAAPIAGAEDYKHFFVADTLNDYINTFKKLNDKELCANIGANARKLVSSTFTWENYQNLYISYIEMALEKSKN